MALGTKRKAANVLSKQPLDLPPGTIHAFAGATAPEGWAICDGSTVSRTTYAALYAAIGDNWGNGDGSTTFHLPDLRGRFLRGHDNAAGRDVDRASRTASNSGGNTGDAVGSVQNDGIQGHNHSLVFKGVSSSSSNSGTVSVETQSVTNNSTVNMNSNNEARSMVTNGSNGTPRISNETRPVNAAVQYIIKL